jgi:hypothetical protein
VQWPPGGTLLGFTILGLAGWGGIPSSPNTSPVMGFTKTKDKNKRPKNVLVFLEMKFQIITRKFRISKIFTDFVSNFIEGILKFAVKHPK